MSRATWLVPGEQAGSRLDRALAAAAGVPRNQVQGWIEAGRVEIDGVVVERPGRALKVGERIGWEPPPLRDPRIEGEPGELAVLYLDEQLLVIDKPPGLAMHPGAGRSTATLAHRLLGRFPELGAVGGPGRPGIVHRLDRDTSGVLVVARTAASYEHLSRAFAARRVEKRYLAVSHGILAPASGEIDQPISRHAVKRKQMAVRPGGRRALTRFRTLAESPSVRGRGAFSLLELDLLTGRTHQIRVHLKHLRHPIAGDATYGAPASAAPRLALHAWKLAFEHPGTGERVEFRATFPVDLVTFWSGLGGELPTALL